MKQKVIIEQDFEIDKLTNSIENAISGEVFDTIISKVVLKEIKKTDWLFDWKAEISDKSRSVFKLTTVNNSNIIHGLISITDKGDHIFMNLVESAKFNKGKTKLYNGVAGNLVAYACKVSFEAGYEGVISFVSKSVIIEHYKITLGAKVLYGNVMAIETKEATFLTTKYFKDFKL